VFAGSAGHRSTYANAHFNIPHSLHLPLHICVLHFCGFLRCLFFTSKYYLTFNPLIATLKPQSNWPLYSNTVIGTLAVDGWTVTIGTARRGLGGLRTAARPSFLAVLNVTVYPSTAWVLTSYYSMWHDNCHLQYKRHHILLNYTRNS